SSARKENFRRNVALATSPQDSAPAVEIRTNGEASYCQTSKKTHQNHRSTAKPRHPQANNIADLAAAAPAHGSPCDPHPRTNLQAKPLVRPPDLVQPDFLRHTLGPSAA